METFLLKIIIIMLKPILQTLISLLNYLITIKIIQFNNKEEWSAKEKIGNLLKKAKEKEKITLSETLTA
jgi:hypothetical protein